MINWIIGGLIIGFTIYIVGRTIVRMSRGEGACDCSECPSGAKGGCCSKKN